MLIFYANSSLVVQPISHGIYCKINSGVASGKRKEYFQKQYDIHNGVAFGLVESMVHFPDLCEDVVTINEKCYKLIIENVW